MTPTGKNRSKSAEQSQSLFLYPGDWYFGGQPMIVRTTLGSCISMVLWSASKSIGGMCHYMLPRRPGAENDTAADGRYADDALRLMAGAAARWGTRLSDYQVRIFGGADMFVLPRISAASVAACNIAAADQLARQYQLAVQARDVGGRNYRQIKFNIANGEVWVGYGAQSQRSAETRAR